MVAPSARVVHLAAPVTQLPSCYPLCTHLTPQEHHHGYTVLVVTLQHPKGLPNGERATRQTRVARLLASMGVGGWLATERRYFRSDEAGDHLHAHGCLVVPPGVSDADLQAAYELVTGYTWDHRIARGPDDFRPFDVQPCHDVARWLAYASKYDAPELDVWGSVAARMSVPGLQPQPWGAGPERAHRCLHCDKPLPGGHTKRLKFCPGTSACRVAHHRGK